VVRLAVALPSIWKVNRFEKKRLLRESLRGSIPDDVIDAPKVGFGVPYSEWLRTSLYEFCRSNILDPSFVRRMDLDGAMVERLLKQHKDYGSGRGFILWKLLQLAIWNNHIRLR
jgi:asparagine synthase (glutamine-hydrolysing)